MTRKRIDSSKKTVLCISTAEIPYAVSPATCVKKELVLVRRNWSSDTLRIFDTLVEYLGFVSVAQKSPLVVLSTGSTPYSNDFTFMGSSFELVNMLERRSSYSLVDTKAWSSEILDLCDELIGRRPQPLRIGMLLPLEEPYPIIRAINRLHYAVKIASNKRAVGQRRCHNVTDYVIESLQTIFDADMSVDARCLL